MSQIAEQALRHKALRYSFWEGVLYAVMVGTTESYAIYFAIKMGLSNVQLGLVTALPLFVGSCLQAGIPYWISAEHLRKSVLGSVAIQLLGLAGLAWTFFSGFQFSIFFSSLVLYWIGGLVAIPLWVDWFSAWIPKNLFGHFLSNRNAWIALVTLISFSLSSFLLQYLDFIPIFAIFLVGFAARFLNWILFFKTPLPPVSSNAVSSTEEGQLSLSSLPTLLKFIFIFTILFRLAVNISSPYVSSYMLRELKFSLPQYVIICAVPFLGRLLFVSRWGSAAQDFKAHIGIQISMLGICLTPFLWTLQQDFMYLCSLEFISGLMWGGFELCTILIIQSHLTFSCRKILGLHQALMTGGGLIGAFAGSLMLNAGWSYSSLFQISSASRLLTTTSLLVLCLLIPQSRLNIKNYQSFLSTLLIPRLNYSFYFSRLRTEKKASETPPVSDVLP